MFVVFVEESNGDAEVDQVQFSLVVGFGTEVLWLHVSVNDAASVKFSQPLQGFFHDVADGVDGEPATRLGEQLSEVAANSIHYKHVSADLVVFSQLHRAVQKLASGFDHPHYLILVFDHLAVSSFSGLADFERALEAELRVERFVDHAKASFVDEFEDAHSGEHCLAFEALPGIHR